MVDFICMGLLDLWGARTENSTVGFEPGTFRLRSEGAKRWAIRAYKYRSPKDDHILSFFFYVIRITDESPVPKMHIWSILLIPKMHKNPYEHRFIAGSSKCSTKPLSILLTKLLTHIKKGLQKYCETAYSRSGVNQMRILKNSKQLLEHHQSPNFNHITSIKSFDFSTLYTTISPQTLKSILATVIRNSFIHKKWKSQMQILGDDFNFHITNFPFLSSNIHSSPAYAVFISQLIRYARACSSYECFILRAARLSSKLLGQAYVRERWKSSLRKFYGRYGDLIKHYEVPLSQMLHDILVHGRLQWHPQLIRHYTNMWTYYRTGPYYRFWPYYQISGGFHRTLQQVRLVNRGHLLLRTPSPVPFGTCICSNTETILSWTCHVYGPFEFRTSLGTSILLYSI